MDKSCFTIGELVAIYTDPDSNRFNFGKVIAKNDAGVIISSITPNAFSGGLILYDLDDIYKIEKSTAYSQKMEKLITVKKPQFFEPEFSGKDFKKELLELAKTEHKLVMIKILDGTGCDVMGHVEKVADIFCEIRQYSETGDEDGFCIVDLRDISRIHYDDYDNRDYELLIK